MSPVQSVFANPDLCISICRYVPAWHDRRRIARMMHALKLWAADEGVRRMHLASHIVHANQHAEAIALGYRPCSYSVGMSRYFMVRREDPGPFSAAGPFWVPEKRAWYVDIPVTLMKMFSLTRGNLATYRDMMSYYGIRMSYELLPEQDAFRLFLGRSGHFFVRTLSDRVKIGTNWIDYTVSVSPTVFSAGTEEALFPNLAFPMDVDCRTDLSLSLASEIGHQGIGAVVYACSVNGFKHIQKAPYPFMYSSLMTDPCYLGTLHMVFTRFEINGSSSLFAPAGSVQARLVAKLCSTFRITHLLVTDSAAHDMADAHLDTVRVRQRNQFSSGQSMCSLELRCSPAMQMMMSFVADSLIVLGKTDTDFGNFNSSLLNHTTQPYRAGWTEMMDDVLDAMATISECGSFLLPFLNYRREVKCTTPSLDQCVLMHSNMFMLEMIGTVYPLSIFPSVSGVSVNPPIHRPLPFTYIQESQSTMYSIPEYVSQPGSHCRVIRSVEGESNALSKQLLWSCCNITNDRSYAMYDCRGVPAFVRFDRSGYTTLRHTRRSGFSLMDCLVPGKRKRSRRDVESVPVCLKSAKE